MIVADEVNKHGIMIGTSISRISHTLKDHWKIRIDVNRCCMVRGQSRIQPGQEIVKLLGNSLVDIGVALPWVCSFR